MAYERLKQVSEYVIDNFEWVVLETMAAALIATSVGCAIYAATVSAEPKSENSAIVKLETLDSKLVLENKE